MARAAGLTRDDLRSRQVRKLGRGVFAPASTSPSLALHSARILLVAPRGARMAAQTAAALQRLPVSHTDRLYVSVPRGERWACGDVSLLHHDDDAEVVLETPYGMVSATHPVSLPKELRHRMPFVDGVVLADAVLARMGEMASEVHAEWAADPLVAPCAALARAASESVMETRLRLLLHFAGFPEPAVQYAVRLQGRFRRFDLAYPEVKVAVEYDGDHHFASERAKQEDAQRREAAAQEGWLIVSVVAYGIYRNPAGTVERVVHALDSRGLRVTPRDEWRRHFPQRS